MEKEVVVRVEEKKKAMESDEGEGQEMMVVI